MFKIIMVIMELVFLSGCRALKESRGMINKIYNFLDYQDYYDMKDRLEKECEEKNWMLDDIHYDGYPDEIEW